MRFPRRRASSDRGRLNTSKTTAVCIKLALDYVCERTFRVPKIDDGGHQQGHHHQRADADHEEIRPWRAKQGPAKSFDDAGHRVETIQKAQLFGNDAEPGNATGEANIHS